MLKDKKRHALDALSSSTSPSTPKSPPIELVQSTSTISANKAVVSNLSSPAPHYPLIDNQIRSNYISQSNPTGSMLSNIDSSKANPSAAAALVMMNAIMASQQNQVCT